jgi:hypothetical protein
MFDANGQSLAVGQTVTITGTVTKVDEKSVSIIVAAPTGPAGKDVKDATVSLHPAQVLPEGVVKNPQVFQEFPKMLDTGMIAQSQAHEDELRLAPEKADAANKKAADDKKAADAKALADAKARDAKLGQPLGSPGPTKTAAQQRAAEEKAAANRAEAQADADEAAAK